MAFRASPTEIMTFFQLAPLAIRFSVQASGQLPHPGRRDRWLQRATVIAEIVWLTKMSLGFHYFQPPWGTTAQRVYATSSLVSPAFLSLLSPIFPERPRQPCCSSRPSIARDPARSRSAALAVVGQLSQRIERPNVIGNWHLRGDRNWFLEMHDCARLGWKVTKISSRTEKNHAIWSRCSPKVCYVYPKHNYQRRAPDGG